MVVPQIPVSALLPDKFCAENVERTTAEREVHSIESDGYGLVIVIPSELATNGTRAIQNSRLRFDHRRRAVT
jgi:hypothetical protein